MIHEFKLKINPKMIVGLKGIISGGVSTKDFSAVTKISEDESKSILDEFVKNNIGTKQGNFYYFEEGDKLKIAISLLEKGFAIDEISVALDWKNFEGLTAEILSSKNFAVMKNMILTKP